MAEPAHTLCRKRRFITSEPDDLARECRFGKWTTKDRQWEHWPTPHGMGGVWLTRMKNEAWSMKREAFGKSIGIRVFHITPDLGKQVRRPLNEVESRSVGKLSIMKKDLWAGRRHCRKSKDSSNSWNDCPSWRACSAVRVEWSSKRIDLGATFGVRLTYINMRLTWSWTNIGIRSNSSPMFQKASWINPSRRSSVVNCKVEDAADKLVLDLMW